MAKNLFYSALSLMGLMGALAIGVVNAEVSEPYGHVEYTLNENKDFEAQVITITDGEDTITILDRNLGATDAGTGCEDPSWGTACAEGDATYGYHFQRGNNYGFKSTGEVQSGTDKAEWNSAYANKGYYGTTYIKSDWNPYGGDWWEDSTNNSANHYNLWGGSLTETTDGAGNTIDIWDADYLNGNDWKVNPDTVKNRQGPCPENFHVPSAGELAKLTKMFGLDNGWSNYEEVSSAMHSQLKIPFAGLRSYYDALAYNLGGYAYLWSSSPYSASSPYSRDFYLGVDGGLVVDGTDRADADSVRCFYDFYQPFPQSLTLSFMSGDVEVWSGEVESGSVYTDVPGEDSEAPIPNMTKEGYDFDGWFLEGADEAFDFNEPITENLTLYAQRTKKTYTIKWIDGDGNELKTDSVEYGDTPSYQGATPTKTATSDYTYTFNGTWLPEIVEATDNAEYVAQFDATAVEKKSSGYSGGGGRSSKTSDDSEKSTETGNEADTSATEPHPNPLLIGEGDREAAGEVYSDEFQQAYEFAYKNGITTMDTIDKANMDGKLTRIAMAKMLSQYAINVLGQKPANITVPKFSDITEKMDADYDNGVTLAYQLGIMGINMPDNKFRPNDEVTRAEFATALSRMLYSTPDGKPYYVTHLEKLKAEGIITNDDPKMKELRGYVMIMLKRSAE